MKVEVGRAADAHSVRCASQACRVQAEVPMKENSSRERSVVSYCAVGVFGAFAILLGAFDGLVPILASVFRGESTPFRGTGHVTFLGLTQIPGFVVAPLLLAAGGLLVWIGCRGMRRCFRSRRPRDDDRRS